MSRKPEDLEKVIFAVDGTPIKVSANDFDFLNNYRWRIKRVGRPGDQGYAITARSGGGEISMQAMILWDGGPAPKGRIADHINQDKLDNRSENLRNIKRGYNRANSQKATSKSRLKGAYQRPSGKWFSVISIDGKRKHLGDFDTPEEAHQAYTYAASKREYV